MRRTAGAVPDHHRVRAHRLQGQRGVLQRLALAERRALGREVDDVGREPLGGGLERDPGAGGVLEEEVDHRAPAQGRQLLDRPVGQRAHLVGGAQYQLGVLAGQVGGTEQVALHRAPHFGHQDGDGVDAVDRLDTDPDALRERGGEVLADEVGADRQLAVAAVDQDGQLHGLRPADLGERVERGTDRAAGVEHVVDEHHGLAVDAARRDVGRHQRPGGLEAQVVAVHGDVERADRHRDALDRGHPFGDPLGQGYAARGNPEQDQVGGAAVALEDLVGDAGEGPGDVTGVEDGARFRRDSVLRAGWAHTCGLTSFSASRDGSLKDVANHLHRVVTLHAGRARVKPLLACQSLAGTRSPAVTTPARPRSATR